METRTTDAIVHPWPGVVQRLLGNLKRWG